MKFQTEQCVKVITVRRYSCKIAWLFCKTSVAWANSGQDRVGGSLANASFATVSKAEPREKAVKRECTRRNATERKLYPTLNIYAPSMLEEIAPKQLLQSKKDLQAKENIKISQMKQTL